MQNNEESNKTMQNQIALPTQHPKGLNCGLIVSETRKKQASHSRHHPSFTPVSINRTTPFPCFLRSHLICTSQTKLRAINLPLS